MPVVIHGHESIASIGQALKEFPKRLNQAQATAINKTLAGMKTEAKRAITERANIKSGAVARFIEIDKATIETPVGVLDVTKGKRIPVHYFAAKSAGPGMGIQYQIDRTKPWKVIPNAWGYPNKKANGKAQTRGFKYVAVRRGKERLPLRFPSGPSIWGIFNAFGVWQVVKDAAERRFKIELERAVKFHLGVLSGDIKKRTRDGIVVRGKAN